MFCLQIKKLRVLRLHKEKFGKVTIIAKKKKASPKQQWPPTPPHLLAIKRKEKEKDWRRE